MPKYIVRSEIKNENGLNIISLQCEVIAKSSVDAVAKGYKTWNEMGYTGPFWNGRSENVEDAHDVWYSTW